MTKTHYSRSSRACRGSAGHLQRPPSFVQAAQPETDYDVRQEVIWALSQIGGDEVIERLEHFANITDDEDEIELIEDSIEYLNSSAPTTPNSPLCLTNRTLGLTMTTMTLTAMTMMTSSKSPWIWKNGNAT